MKTLLLLLFLVTQALAQFEEKGPAPAFYAEVKKVITTLSQQDDFDERTDNKMRTLANKGAAVIPALVKIFKEDSGSRSRGSVIAFLEYTHADISPAIGAIEEALKKDLAAWSDRYWTGQAISLVSKRNATLGREFALVALRHSTESLVQSAAIDSLQNSGKTEDVPVLQEFAERIRSKSSYSANLAIKAQKAATTLQNRVAK